MNASYLARPRAHRPPLARLWLTALAIAPLLLAPLSACANEVMAADTTQCEATIASGSHVAARENLAIAGALEEAQDTCYPGKSEPLDTDCQQEENLRGQPVYRCTQTVTCNLCGEDLQRKYEALD